jgi:hypothetical protein
VRLCLGEKGKAIARICHGGVVELWLESSGLHEEDETRILASQDNAERASRAVSLRSSGSSARLCRPHTHRTTASTAIHYSSRLIARRSHPPSPPLVRKETESGMIEMCRRRRQVALALSRFGSRSSIVLHPRFLSSFSNFDSNTRR